MLAVSLLIFDAVVPSSVTGVLDLLAGANRYQQMTGKEPAFAVELVGECPPAFAPLAFKSFSTATRPGLVIVPSFMVDDLSVLSRYPASIRWLKTIHGTGAEIASLCAGSYFLAEAGLLDGKTVASHWAVLEDMQRRYPAIRTTSDRVITDQDGVYTSGGAFSSLKLVLYLIEKFCGREAALWISKMYAIELDRGSPAHFAVFTGQHQHGDTAILQAQAYLEKHYQDELSIDLLAGNVHMGKRNFIRRFKAATNNTPFEYLQRVRIESAKKAIERNERDLPLIMDESGYRDPKAFRTIFKRITGLSPMEYKRKYARRYTG
ncbi:GlxA family transcriptional regulator [Dinghuibacter silviterrae]|uniref:AraC family transcriptional regulator with amidase-like domain n=1 Tax=Dinghuibacter silviterrae TaxID=1539049 RepID=A0A4R8DV20_9BACT|nr:helix-turn-helix domain-containing protein [Dinghuibacter silviterrae]TDX02029.1 AraC family transcriptional regulator with amidase-like domain [Dinghuibacter silviterrae]